jgi:hypothetical protein
MPLTAGEPDPTIALAAPPVAVLLIFRQPFDEVELQELLSGSVMALASPAPRRRKAADETTNDATPNPRIGDLPLTPPRRTQ